jgi:ubiquinone/menaquinone biosynthesis C-methylase UbiE
MIMTNMLEFDADAARKVQAVYTTADVVRQREAVLSAVDVKPGEHVLDVGVGPRFLAAELAAAVGSSGRVCGIDISDDMLAIAARRSVRPGSARVELSHGSATEIPFDNESFDLVTCTQVLEYVSDVPAALGEFHRVLRPGGRLLVLDTDWDTIVWHSADEQRTSRVLGAWAQHLADPHLPRTLGRSLSTAGFEVATPFVLTLLNTGYHPETYSGGLIGIVASFVVGRDGLTEHDVNSWVADLTEMGPAYFFSLNRYVFGATKP